MKPSLFGVVAVAAVASLLSAPAHALRCKHKLISVGDRSVKLLHYCGKPYAVQARPASVALVANLGQVLFPAVAENLLIEEWTYNFGPNRLIRVIWLENGVVARIEQAGYGFGPDE